MTFQIRRSVLAAGAVLIASILMTACEVNLNSEGLSSLDKRTYTVTGQPEVVLDTFDGAIEIHSWDRNEVEVEIEKRAMEQSLIDEIKVEAEQQGDRIVVRITGPRRSKFSGVTIGVNISPTARLRVVVPRSANLDVKSGDGSIRAEAIDGKIVLHTSDGRVTASRLSGDIQIRSGDGSLRLDHMAGKLDLETEDGSIGLDGSPTVLRAKTGDGSIRISVDPDSPMADNWNLDTGDGTVVLTLPSTFHAELDAETRDGSVRSTHPQLRDQIDEGRRGEDGDDRRERRRVLRARMGDGGKTLRIRTGDGSIRIEH